MTCVNGTDIESEVYTVNVYGSGEARLTDTPGLDGMPTWSPGGSRIAFVSGDTKDNSNIYVVNSDGSGLTKLTDTPADDAFPAGRP